MIARKDLMKIFFANDGMFGRRHHHRHADFENRDHYHGRRDRNDPDHIA
jgi:hypothetical protein